MTLDNETRNRILTTIDGMREDIVRFCSDLVKIPSITPTYMGVDVDEVLGGETRVSEFVAPVLERLGFQNDLWEEAPKRANLVGKLEGAGGGKSLILSGHVDVVPTPNPEKWTDPPFSGEVKDDRIWGRGSSDMKGGVAAMVKAVEAIQKCGVKLKGDLLVECTVGEETGDGATVGAAATVDRGYQADAAIIPEPTDAIWCCSGGLLWLSLGVTGKTGHGFVRYEMIRAGGQGTAVGVNAIEKAFKVCAALRELEGEWGFNKNHRLLPAGHSTLGPNVIRGGPGAIETPFIIPDTCTVEYCIWYPPHLDVEAIKKEVEERVQWVAAGDEWLKDNPPELDWKFHWTRYAIPEDHPIISTVSKAHQAVTGAPAGAIACPAVVDAAFMTHKQVPSICYGTGGLGLFSIHGVDEFVVIDDLIRATKVLALAVLDWCEVEA